MSITRYEIESLRRGAVAYHLPANWQQVVRLCDAALGVLEVSEERPVWVPYESMPKPERY